MTAKLCIQWKMDGRTGYGTAYENTPAEKQRLESWANGLKREFKNAEFAVIEHPHGKSYAMPGSVAALVLARQPSGRA